MDGLILLGNVPDVHAGICLTGCPALDYTEWFLSNLNQIFGQFE
ncbi:hypothetical protein JOC74_000063 [Bacillus capparidis]|uniref:Uncharacterized protein n=1 Tax=Bacillus capparidis TaxID=1840411 RepID=A0ABS4CQK3_9BACI|nr:hypothetical protein [Bacillus capparidis]